MGKVNSRESKATKRSSNKSINKQMDKGILPDLKRNGENRTRKIPNHIDNKWDSKEAILKNIVVRVEVYRNPRPTKVEEISDKVIVFRTPTMRAKATVTVPPVPLGQVWTIGWVQSVHDMRFVNIYGQHGFTSWEFPQLNLNMVGVNDSDGETYPFYGHEKEFFQIEGPVARDTTFVVEMSDSPASHVTLNVPSKHDSSGDIDLTHISRKQRFNTWLVALNDRTGECIELKCLDWELDVSMVIDELAPNGMRVQLRDPKEQSLPRINKKIPRIPQCAQLPPDANHAQMLVFRPHSSRQNVHQVKIIVAPQHQGHTTPTERELQNDQSYELAKQVLCSAF